MTLESIGVALFVAASLLLMFVLMTGTIAQYCGRRPRLRLLFRNAPQETPFTRWRKDSRLSIVTPRRSASSPASRRRAWSAAGGTNDPSSSAQPLIDLMKRPNRPTALVNVPAA